MKIMAFANGGNDWLYGIMYRDDLNETDFCRSAAGSFAGQSIEKV